MSAPQCLGASDVLAFCGRNGVQAVLHSLGAPVPTVANAAAAVGAEPGRIVKSLVFLAAAEPVVVVAAGEGRVSYPLLAAALGVNRKALRFVSAAAALELTGYPVGGMPPFGHLSPLRTLVDAVSVPRAGVVFAGAGTQDTLVELNAADLVTACGGVRVALTAPTPE